MIIDGTSNTYMLGEKYLMPDYYFNGQDAADNETMYAGYDNDISRVHQSQPIRRCRTRPAIINQSGFGSAHANGFQMAFCDGSVQMINYSIDPETHRRLGNRKDGLPVDAKAF